MLCIEICAVADFPNMELRGVLQKQLPHLTIVFDPGQFT